MNGHVRLQSNHPRLVHDSAENRGRFFDFGSAEEPFFVWSQASKRILCSFSTTENKCVACNGCKIEFWRELYNNHEVCHHSIPTQLQVNLFERNNTSVIYTASINCLHW